MKNEINEDIVLKSISNIINEKKNKEVDIFYVHNLNYDGLLILNSISKTQINFDVFIRDLQIYYIRIDSKIEFKCSYKLLPMSLKNIAVFFKLDQKLSFPYLFSKKENLFYIGIKPSINYYNNKFEYDNASTLIDNKYSGIFNFKEYSIIYCTRDVKITREFIIILKKLIKETSIEMSSVYSAPSLSLKIFIKKFNNNKITFKYSNFIHSFLKKAYFGGRCEIYGNPYQNELIYHYDFSGMYGQCMMEKFCYGKFSILNNPETYRKPGFYCIEYESNFEFPILPHRSIREEKLMFTNGIQNGFFWFEEILLFEKYGGKVNKIIYGLHFEKYDYVFNEFIEYFTKIRNLGGAYKIFGKLIINSLYGRLGMDNPEKISFFIKKEDFKEYDKNFKILTFKELNNFMLIDVEKDENVVVSKNLKRNIKSNIGVAASITSKGRIKLYEAQQDVIKNKGRILYSDTDSIFAGYLENVTNQKHGSVFWDGSKEDTCICDAVFVSPKTYALKYKENEVIKIKGLNDKKISFSEFKRKFYMKEDLIITNFSFIKKKNLIIEEDKNQKIFKFERYNKRKFIENNKKTVPYLYKNYEYF